MRNFNLYRLLGAVIALCFCANAHAGWFGSSSNNEIVMSARQKTVEPLAKYAATIHISKYLDQRAAVAPRKIGIVTAMVMGVSGKELILDTDVADVVTNEMQRRFAREGMQVVDTPDAMFELGGVVKKLVYDVKNRDEIEIVVETTLTDRSTGKVLWSGIVAEKDDRFAGVAGNSKSDVAEYLHAKLGVISKKTYEAVSASLVALHPELFDVLPGAKPINGVTVLFVAGASQPAATVPVTSVMEPPKATGKLVLTTKPTRAKVYLEDVYYGLSPLQVEVEAKIHGVSVKMDGYKTSKEKVSVRKGEATELEIELHH